MSQKIQTVIFKKSSWSAETARSWLSDHDMRSDKLDETEESFRFRQFDPADCVEGSFQTLTENFPDGVAAVSCETGRAVEAEPAISGIEDAVEKRRKFYLAEVKAHKNGDVEAYISTETIDRVGDIIRAKGWELDNYKKTGAPVLFSHDYSLPPIGKAVEIEKQRKGLWAVTRFHEKTQLSRDLALLARDNDMKAWSVGFSALEPPESRTEDGVFKGYIFTKQELLEYSLVPVPANPDAVSKAIRMAHKGLISHETAVIFAGPSPLADKDSGADDRKDLSAVQASKSEHEARMAFLKFERRLIDAQAGRR